MRLKMLKRVLLASASVTVISALLIATARNDSEAIKRAQDSGKVLQVLVSASATSTASVFTNATTGARYTWPAVYHKPAAPIRGDPDPGHS
jgi:hypothetical protein